MAAGSHLEFKIKILYKKWTYWTWNTRKTNFNKRFIIKGLLGAQLLHFSKWPLAAIFDFKNQILNFFNFWFFFFGIKMQKEYVFDTKTTKLQWNKVFWVVLESSNMAAGSHLENWFFFIFIEINIFLWSWGTFVPS